MDEYSSVSGKFGLCKWLQREQLIIIIEEMTKKKVRESQVLTMRRSNFRKTCRSKSYDTHGYYIYVDYDHAKL